MSKLVYFVLFTMLISCGEKPLEKTIVRGQAFGTTFSIQAYTNQNLDLEKGIDSILNLVNKSVSTYLPDSDISKINRGDTSVIVDQIFIDNCFPRGQENSRLSECTPGTEVNSRVITEIINSRVIKLLTRVTPPL